MFLERNKRMYHIDIKVGESIGELELGMTRDEVEIITQELPSSIHHNFSYYGNRLREIELVNGRNILAVLAGYDIELFRTTVEELVPKLSEIAPCVKDPDYMDGTLFNFPQLGLKLWREDNMTLNDLKDEKYTALDKDEFEYYREKLYFDTVLIYPRDVTK